MTTNHPSQQATFGAGCFWQVQAAFQGLSGVTATEVGYAGGTTLNPSYEQVCSDNTGHVEVSCITFDPQQVSYDELLKLFWTIHDPTQMNRQGPDIGAQYRSVIFYHNDEQKRLALESKKQQQDSGRFSTPIVTAIEPIKNYFPAEEYHQNYVRKHGLSCKIQ